MFDSDGGIVVDRPDAAVEHTLRRHSPPRPRQPPPSQYSLRNYDTVTTVVAGAAADGEDGLEYQILSCLNQSKLLVNIEHLGSYYWKDNIAVVVVVEGDGDPGIDNSLVVANDRPPLVPVMDAVASVPSVVAGVGLFAIADVVMISVTTS